MMNLEILETAHECDVAIARTQSKRENRSKRLQSDPCDAFKQCHNMGLTSNTGLIAAVPSKVSTTATAEKVDLELFCEVTPAPYMLRPFAGLYNPFSNNCSVLCNHPADTDAREVVKKAKDAWDHHGKAPHFGEDLAKSHGMYGGDKNRTPHDIVTEDMFRRYTETDSRPHTPAPTLASGKSRGSRRCLTPDQPHTRPALVVDLRRSHSQETIYYHGYTTSDMAVSYTSTTIERSTLPSLNLSEGPSNRLGKVRCEQLPPLASPLVLSKRSLPPKEAAALKAVRKNQLKALNLGKTAKNKSKVEGPGSNRSKGDKEATHDENPALDNTDDGSEVRRRGKRRRKGRQGGSDRLTSAGLAAQTQQDPETQIAGIGTDSHNPSSRGSIAQASECDSIVPSRVKAAGSARQPRSFLDDDILKYLHREVDEEAIHTEFDTKRRYVLVEALRTRPDRPYGSEMQSLLKEMKVPASSLGDWLHIPRVYSRQNAQFSLPIDSYALETLTPMNYAARFVTIKKSKMLLYLTVLRKFRPGGYRMPIESIKEGLALMMGGILSPDQAQHLSSIMEWETYVEEETSPDDIKLTITEPCAGGNGAGDFVEPESKTLRYRTWCGVCAICERMFGRLPPREKDSPDGIEVSDFTMLETKLPLLKVHSGLVEILNTVRAR